MGEIDPTQAADGHRAGHTGKGKGEEQAAAHPELATNGHSMVSELVVALTGCGRHPASLSPRRVVAGTNWRAFLGETEAKRGV